MISRNWRHDAQRVAQDVAVARSESSLESDHGFPLQRRRAARPRSCERSRYLHEDARARSPAPARTPARGRPPRPAPRCAPRSAWPTMPRSIARVRMPWTIGKVPAFLMSISSEPTPTEAMRVLSTPSAGVSKVSIRWAKRASRRLFAAHQSRPARPWPAPRRSARPATATASKKMPRFIARIGVRVQHPDPELPDEAVHRLRPDRVADHDVAGAGRKAEAVERAREGLAEAVELRLPAPARPAEARCPGRCARSARPALREPISIRQPLLADRGGRAAGRTA